MIRRRYYCKYSGKIFPCRFNGEIVVLRSNDKEDVLLRGFEKNIYFDGTEKEFYDNWNTKYSKDVPIEQIDWFCNIGTYGYYKGYKVGVVTESKDEYVIVLDCVPLDSEVFSEENGFERVDIYLVEGKVPKSEVTNIAENKTPINKKYKAPDNWDF